MDLGAGNGSTVVGVGNVMNERPFWRRVKLLLNGRKWIGQVSAFAGVHSGTCWSCHSRRRRQSSAS